MERFAHNTDGLTIAPERRKVFTPETANRSLVLVKRIVADVVSEYARLLELQEMIDSAQVADGEPARQAEEEIVRVAERLRYCVAEIEDVGVTLRDWSVGIVDFPAAAGGRSIWLCWKLGEPGVAHWHEMEDGFAERRPIEAWEQENIYFSAEIS